MLDDGELTSRLTVLGKITTLKMPKLYEAHESWNYRLIPNAYNIMLTPNLVLSSARNLLFRKS
jgi:hypothetical protein